MKKIFSPKIILEKKKISQNDTNLTKKEIITDESLPSYSKNIILKNLNQKKIFYPVIIIRNDKIIKYRRFCEICGCTGTYTHTCKKKNHEKICTTCLKIHTTFLFTKCHNK